jgi:hypothetical protein
VDRYEFIMVGGTLLILAIPATLFGLWQQSVYAGAFVFTLLLIWNYKP